MMESDKKRLKQEYKQTPRQIGVFLIRNLANDRLLVVAGLDLPGKINRHRFQLTMGVHPNKRLQADWNETGGEGFAFEVFDQLTPREDPDFDYSADLAALEELCLESLQPFDERGYNEPKISREERLRRIAARRANDL